ncbi:hypothetical protein Lpp122_2428 [Lacticaseibacillus paracasei subsp. paracasei Lpp122]|uniref:Uncharacterized protein n=1 Tax=Lacticaseibacillus paracasei subsp. paracasei Lpp122 TaxID=1256218 RepID=A0A8E0I3H0_LACPA|nr:hypothetical protein Lpp122_2428 [Lacticaseibacillus paracasei subsp. paracasei Lpp122]
MTLTFVFVVSLVKSQIKKDVLTLKGKNVLFLQYPS